MFKTLIYVSQIISNQKIKILIKFFYHKMDFQPEFQAIFSSTSKFLFLHLK